jgi:hypothetical protein
MQKADPSPAKAQARDDHRAKFFARCEVVPFQRADRLRRRCPQRTTTQEDLAKARHLHWGIYVAPRALGFEDGVSFDFYEHVRGD